MASLNLYMGEVVENNDPDKVGKVQIRIPEIDGEEGDDDFTETDFLYWYEPLTPFGAGYQYGSLVIPPVGSIVWCLVKENPDGDPYCLYIGATFGSESEDDDDEDNTKSFGSQEVPAGELETPTEAIADYPNCPILFKSINGSVLYCDKDGNLILKSANEGSIIIKNAEVDQETYEDKKDLYKLVADKESIRLTNETGEYNIKVTETSALISNTDETVALGIKDGALVFASDSYAFETENASLLIGVDNMDLEVRPPSPTPPEGESGETTSEVPTSEIPSETPAEEPTEPDTTVKKISINNVDGILARVAEPDTPTDGEDTPPGGDEPEELTGNYVNINKDKILIRVEASETPQDESSENSESNEEPSESNEEEEITGNYVNVTKDKINISNGTYKILIDSEGLSISSGDYNIIINQEGALSVNCKELSIVTESGTMDFKENKIQLLGDIFINDEEFPPSPTPPESGSDPSSGSN